MRQNYPSKFIYDITFRNSSPLNGKTVLADDVLVKDGIFVFYLIEGYVVGMYPIDVVLGIEITPREGNEHESKSRTET